jgi:hypothetical protein
MEIGANTCGAMLVSSQFSCKALEGNLGNLAHADAANKAAAGKLFT